MVNVPAAPLEGSSDVSTESRPMLFMVEQIVGGDGGLRSVLFTTSGSEVVEDQRVGPLAVGVMNQSLTVDIANQPLTVDIANYPDTPVLYNVVLTVADTQYSQVLPTGCQHFEFNCKEMSAIRYAWVTGKVATPTAPYRTLQAGAQYFQDNVAAGGLTLYFASSVAGVTVEVETWA